MNSDPRGTAERPASRVEIIEALADVAKNAFVNELTKATRTCLNCDHFDETKELCNKFGQRPPARIIAFGCEHYVDRVPF